MLDSRECTAQSALKLSHMLSKNLNNVEVESDIAFNSLCYGCALVANESSSLYEFPIKVVKTNTLDAVKEYLLDENC